MSKRIIIIALVSLFSFMLHAEQIKVIDVTYTHDGWYKHFGTGSMATVPKEAHKEWVAHFRFDVLGFGGNPAEFMLQPCFFWDKKASCCHACYHRDSKRFNFTEKSVKYVQYPNPKMWNYKIANWKNIIDFMLINNYPNDDRKSTPSKPKVRCELFMVKPGDKLNAPSHWIEPADWSACYKGCWEKGAVYNMKGKTMMDARKKQDIAISIAESGTALSFNGVSAEKVTGAMLTDMRGYRATSGKYSRNKKAYTMRLPMPPGVYLVHLFYDDGSRGCKKILHR